jgi:hypothetical protein
MTLNPASYSTRSLSLIMIAAFAGVALWLFAPIGNGGGSGSGSGDTANGALPPSLAVNGDVQVQSENNIVTRLVVPLIVRGEEGIDLGGASGSLHAETAMSETAVASVPGLFAVDWLDGNGDTRLDPGEQAVMTVDLPHDSTIHPGNPLDLVIKTNDGGRLVIEDVLDR